MPDYPSLSKSWQYSVNQRYPALGSGNNAIENPQLMLGVVNSLLGFLSTPVTLAGTVTTTNGSTAITFSTSQTLLGTAILYFSNQPGVPYFLTGAVSGTSGTLTANYTGIGGGGQTTIACSAITNPWTVVSSSNNGVTNSSNNWVQIALSGTVTTTFNSTSITFSGNQTLPIGAALMFSNQPGVLYYLNANVTASTSGTLTTAYTGTGGAGQTTLSTGLTWAAAGSTHSWIVLKQTGIGSNFQVLIDLSTTLSYNATISMSPSVGFTGGTISAAPTATDSVTVVSNTAWGGDNTGNVQYKLHVLQTTDGACTRIFVCSYQNSTAGVARGFGAFEVPQNPVTGWTNPCIAVWGGSNSATSVPTLGNLYQAANTVGRGVSNMTLFWTGEGVTNSGTLITSVFLSPNELNQELPLLPIGLYSATVSNRGRHGSLFDIWWGPAQFLTAPAIQFPGATAGAFAQFGSIVVPWNGTTVQMA